MQVRGLGNERFVELILALALGYALKRSCL